MRFLFLFPFYLVSFVFGKAWDKQLLRETAWSLFFIFDTGRFISSFIFCSRVLEGNANRRRVHR